MSDVDEPSTLIFYMTDSAAALALAEAMATPTFNPQLREVSGLMGFDRRPGRVIIMPDVPKHQRAAIRGLYPEICEDAGRRSEPPSAEAEPPALALPAPVAPAFEFAEPPKQKRKNRRINATNVGH